MKKILEVTSETLLLVALIVLFAIPVIIYNGLGPTTRAPELTNIQRAEEKVLGTTTIAEQNFATELLPSKFDDIQLEELEKISDLYQIRVLIGSGDNNNREESLIRIVNTAGYEQRVTFSLIDASSQEDLKNVKLAFDETTVGLDQMAAKQRLEPSLTLETNEWITLKVIVDKDLENPTTFVLQADFTTK